VQLEDLGKSKKKFSDLIGKGTCIHLACSIVPQPTPLPCAPVIENIVCECKIRTFLTL
jgi:hypothetical protein